MRLCRALKITGLELVHTIWSIQTAPYVFHKPPFVCHELKCCRSLKSLYLYGEHLHTPDQHTSIAALSSLTSLTLLLPMPFTAVMRLPALETLYLTLDKTGHQGEQPVLSLESTALRMLHITGGATQVSSSCVVVKLPNNLPSFHLH